MKVKELYDKLADRPGFIQYRKLLRVREAV